VSTIPTDATISSAQCSLYVTQLYKAGSADTINHHKDICRVTTSWDEGTKNNGCDASNWVYATDAVTWTTPGGDYSATDYGYFRTSATGWMRCTSSGIVDLIQFWVENPDSNFGMIIVSDTTANDSCYFIASSDTSLASIRPRLNVVWSAGSTAIGGGAYDAANYGYFKTLDTGWVVCDDYDFHGLVQEWVASPSTKYGMIVMSDIFDQDSCYTIASSEYADTSKRPRLTLSWSSGLSISGDGLYFKMQAYDSRVACSTAVYNGGIGAVGMWDTQTIPGSAGQFQRYTGSVKLVWSETW